MKMKFHVVIFFAGLTFASAVKFGSQESKDTYIAGGDPTTIDQYPHSLALYDASLPNARLSCGASVIG